MTTIVFAGGGTGGHLYPGLAIARALVRIQPDVLPFFIGARRGVERDILPDSGFEFELLDLHPLYRARFWENWRTLRGAAGAWESIGKRLRAERPSAVVGTGGYASGLTLAYAATHGATIVIQEQNAHPGLTTRFFSRYAQQVHLGFAEARARLSPGRRTMIYDSGNPIEPPPPDARDKIKGRAAWGFPAAGGTVILIYGGSQGSQAINSAVADWVRSGLPPDLYLIWGTGTANYDRFSSLGSDRVKVRPYLSPIGDAYRAADVAVSRAGAMATAELCAWGIPMILVPLPTAAADHQTANARALEAGGAARVIVQSRLAGGALADEIAAMISEPARRSAATEAALRLARPRAAEAIAVSILELIHLR